MKRYMTAYKVFWMSRTPFYTALQDAVNKAAWPIVIESLLGFLANSKSFK